MKKPTGWSMVNFAKFELPTPFRNVVQKRPSEIQNKKLQFRNHQKQFLLKKSIQIQKSSN